jgi:hypothetical protein
MKYSEYRGNIKSGDVIATSHPSPVRLFTASEFNHNGIVWKVGKRLFILEAVWPKVRLVPLSVYAKKGFYVIHTKTPPNSAELEFLLSKVGVSRYSIWDCVLAFFKKLDIGADNNYECSELVIAARKLSGVFLGNVAVPSYVVEEALNQGMSIVHIEGG